MDIDGYLLLSGLEAGKSSLENSGGLYSYMSGASGPGKGAEFMLEVPPALDVPFCGFPFACWKFAGAWNRCWICRCLLVMASSLAIMSWSSVEYLQADSTNRQPSSERIIDIFHRKNGNKRKYRILCKNNFVPWMNNLNKLSCLSRINNLNKLARTKFPWADVELFNKQSYFCAASCQKTLIDAVRWLWLVE